MRRWVMLGAAAMLAAGSPAMAACEMGQVVELKVTMIGPRPTVDTKINGREARFLVDSGAFFSTISRAVAKEYGLRDIPAPPNFRLGGIGGEQSASATRVETFTLQSIDLHNIEFVVGGTELRGSEGVGLLGQNVLGLADVEYDLGHGAIRIMKTKGCKNANLAYWAKDRPFSIVDIEDINEARRHTVGTITVNGKKIRAVFDTGAASSVMTLAAARRIGIDVDGPGAKPAGYLGGLGPKVVRSWIVPVDSLGLGGEEVRRTSLRVADYDFGNDDMLLGADFFLSHRVYVSNPLRKLFFTYEGGPVFDLRPTRLVDASGAIQAAPGDSGPEPKTADEFARRGAALASRREFAKAIDDMNRAIELSPNEARYYLQRANMRLRVRQATLATADLDKAIELAPGDTEARLLRAQLRTGRRDRSAAIQDLDALDAALAPPSGTRLTLGGLFTANGAFDRAIAQFDRWMAAHPDDSDRATALNGRCWARALAGKDLDRALSDCNTALRARPNTPAYLDSRGLVKLRRGDLDGAIEYYDAALAAQPKLAWALYGRGVARAKKGLAKEAAADREAALAANPDIAERAREVRIGV